MKLGVFTVLFGDKPFEETLDYVKSLGIEAVEIGTGAYPGNKHCDPDKILAGGEAKAKAFKQAVSRRGLIISALSCHGNPLHPNKKIAKEHHEVFVSTCKLAKLLGIDRVITFSGCPGDSDNAVAPNWVTAPWPEDHSKVLEWQWREKVIPYWKEAVKIARENGVNKICLEMHPNFVVYHPESLLRLREAAGKSIGANFDPSHMFWQGIDPCSAIRAIGPAVYHVHAKDTRIYEDNAKVNGVLDTKPYTDEVHRSWIFRTVGYGHGASVWRDIVSTLRMVGYDHVLSIEHEDSLMSGDEGLKKAIAFLKQILITEKPGVAYWA